MEKKKMEILYTWDTRWKGVRSGTLGEDSNCGIDGIDMKRNGVKEEFAFWKEGVR